MKAYPLIYSRTKNVDFVPDFLTRPKDLDCQTALKYVENAMANLDILKTIRYSVFSVGNYCICGGISCVTKYLVEELKKSDSNFQAVSEYLRDCKGRSIACFIGFAIPKSPKSEVWSGRIPDIPLSKYWDVYLEYLKHQWDKSTTHSEELNFPPVTLDEKTYSSNYKPEFEPIQEKKVIRNQKEKLQGTLDYFFDQILNKGSQDSFISDIDRNEWDALKFTYASVSDDFYRALKSTPQTTATQEDPFGNIMGMKKSERSAPVSNGGSKIGNCLPKKVPNHSNTYPPNFYETGKQHQNQKKTTNNNLLVGIVTAAVLVVVIVAIIAMVVGKKSETASSEIHMINSLDDIQKTLKNSL